MVRTFFSILLLTAVPLQGGAQDLTVGGSKILSRLPFIALNQGLFQDEGIEVSHQVISVGKLAMDAVLAGSIDIGIVVDSNLAFASFRETDLKVIATVAQFSLDGVVTCTPERGFERAEVQGSRIGYLPATSSHFFLAKWLSTLNLTMADIVPVTLQPAAMAQALKSGNVAYVSIWEPRRRKLQNLFEAPCTDVSNSRSIYPSYAYLVVQEGTLSTKEHELRRFLRALLNAERYEKEHEEEAQQAYREYTHFDEDSLKSVWEDSRPRVALTEDAVRVVDEGVAWLLSERFQGRPRIIERAARFIDKRLLRSVAPYRVEMRGRR